MNSKWHEKLNPLQRGAAACIRKLTDASGFYLKPTDESLNE